jgi:hypothetical protein
MSLAVAGTLISQDSMVNGHVMPWSIAWRHSNPYCSAHSHNFPLPIAAQVAIYVVYQHLNLGAVQKFRNVWDTVNLAVVSAASSSSFATATCYLSIDAGRNISSKILWDCMRVRPFP